MSGGTGTMVEWTNRIVHLAEGAAHLAHLGGSAGRLAKKLPSLAVITGSSQAGFFYTEAISAFNEQGMNSDHGWEAVGGSVLGAVGAALSLTPWGAPLALAEITADSLGSISGRRVGNRFNANKVVGELFRGVHFAYREIRYR